MTAMTGRCRRHHQNQCEGPVAKGLCVKHRRIWRAMVQDWKDRDAATTPTNPDAVVGHRTPWTDDEIRIALNHPTAEAVELIGRRSYKAVETMRRKLGVPSDRFTWTPAADQVLRDHLSPDAARILGISVTAVRSRRGNAKIPAPTPTQKETAA